MHFAEFQGIELVGIWAFVTPFFSGWLLRVAFRLIYPRMQNWLPPLIMRLGIFSMILACLSVSALIVYWIAEFQLFLLGALLPLFIVCQLVVALRSPEINPMNPDLERVTLR